jgi:hypothetical protein
MLEILGKNEEDPSTGKKDLLGLWVCNHCPSSMKAMEWEDLVSPISSPFLLDDINI